MKDHDKALNDKVQLDETQTEDQRQLVLVVEDDAVLRKLLEVVLDHHGYAVITAATEQEAELALEQWGDTGLALVISDINLSRGHLNQEGYALYERWRGRLPTLPYMLMSADPTNRRLPAIQDGRVYFVEKPFQIETLIGDIRHRLDQPPSGATLNLSPTVEMSDELALSEI